MILLPHSGWSIIWKPWLNLAGDFIYFFIFFSLVHDNLRSLENFNTFECFSLQFFFLNIFASVLGSCFTCNSKKWWRIDQVCSWNYNKHSTCYLKHHLWVVLVVKNYHRNCTCSTSLCFTQKLKLQLCNVFTWREKYTLIFGPMFLWSLKQSDHKFIEKKDTLHGFLSVLSERKWDKQKVV